MASEILLPNQTVSAGGWRSETSPLTPGSATHTSIDEGIAAADDDGTYNRAVPGDSDCQFGFTNPALTGPFDQLVLRARISAPADGSISLDLSGLGPGSFGGIGDWQTVTHTFIGSWTQADLNSLFIGINLSGATGEFKVTAVEVEAFEESGGGTPADPYLGGPCRVVAGLTFPRTPRFVWPG